MRTCAGLLTALTLLLGAVGPAGAGEATHRIRAFFGDANRIIADSRYDAHPEDRLAALRHLVTDMVDFRSAAAIALGAEWTARSAGERDDFVRLFTALLETSVFASVGARARLDSAGITVSYLAEVADGETAIVATTVLTRSDRELSVDYRMTHRQGRWVVYDVTLDGVSLVDNYRAQFQKVMQRSSYVELLTEMRARTAELGRPIARASVAAAPSEAMTLMTAEYRSTVPAWDVARGVDVADVSVPPVAVLGLAISRAGETVAKDTGHVSPRPSALLRLAALPEPPRLTMVDASRPRRPAEAPRLPAVTEATRTPARATQFWVQVGAFRSEEKAMQVATALRDQTVSLLAAPNDPLLRVVVGPFANRDAAASKLREIRARGYDAFIPPSN